MEQEKESISSIEEGVWWKEQADGIIREAHLVPTDCALRIMQLVEEATRRGVQQGKREAWGETMELMYEARDMGYSNMDIRAKINAKLSSLANSSKDKV